MYEDGSPGEIFVRMAKEGSTISGLMDSFATAVSLALQHALSVATNTIAASAILAGARGPKIGEWIHKARTQAVQAGLGLAQPDAAP